MHHRQKFDVRPAMTGLCMALVIAVTGCGRSAPDETAAETPPTTPSTTAPPVAETTTTTAPTEVTYVIQPGDSLSVIAQRFGISTSALADFNAISDVDSIKVGQQIAIPPPSIAANVDWTSDASSTSPDSSTDG